MLAVSSVGLLAQVPGGAASSPVIAEVGGQKITLGELEQNMAAKLFQARQQFYVAERTALEQYLDEQVLANEARRQNITVEQLLERSIHVADPTEDQMRVYFEAVNTDQPFEVMRDKVLQHIRDTRAAKIRAAYVKSLREQAGLRITFDPPTAELAVAQTPILGSPNAPVHLVEFGDFQCPYCQQAHSIIKKLLEEYGAKVSFSFRDFPLPMHPLAPKAAEAARCAAVQGKFWEFYDAMFTNQKLAIPELKEDARKLALDTAAFDKCLDSGEKKDALAKDASEAQHLQLSGTPTFFINGHIYNGAVSQQELRQAIDTELVAAGAAKTMASTSR
jgi:protein-disulfide isomerase